MLELTMFDFPFQPLATVGVIILIITVYCAFILIFPIIFPHILKYPWPLPQDSFQRKKEKSTTVVMAGSYNPPHRGHLAMLSYLSERYGRVIVAIGVNPNKKYDVNPYQRAELVRRMLEDAKLANVDVHVVKGYIWRHAKSKNAKIFYRGIRSWKVDGADERQLQILNTWGPLLLGPTWPIPTKFLQGDPRYIHVSSTLVRNICKSKTDADQVELREIVPESIVKDVLRFYSY